MKEKEELKYTTKELNKIAKYLESNMPYDEFNEFFHCTTYWSYFENILRWIDKNPQRTKDLIYDGTIKEKK